jgi:hypothetical protein
VFLISFSIPFLSASFTHRFFETIFMAYLRVSVRTLAEAKPTPTFRRGRDRRVMANGTLLAESVAGMDNGLNRFETATEDVSLTKLIFFVCSVTFFYNFDAFGPYLTLYFLKYTSPSNVTISHLLR